MHIIVPFELRQPRRVPESLGEGVTVNFQFGDLKWKKSLLLSVELKIEIYKAFRMSFNVLTALILKAILLCMSLRDSSSHSNPLIRNEVLNKKKLEISLIKRTRPKTSRTLRLQ